MKTRRVWIVKENEFSNAAIGKARGSRAVMLADYFVEEGCEVTAWSSLWSHREKKYIEDTRTKIHLRPGLTLNVIPASKIYKKNISIARIAQEREIARLFRKAIKAEEKPDLIYCCWPLIETSYEAVKYGKKYGVPVVIDIRDMWPDIFIQPFSPQIQPLARIVVNLLFKRQTAYALQTATMVTATIPNAMTLTKEYGRKKCPLDHHVFHCYRKPSFSREELDNALLEWKKRGIDDTSFNIVFFGTIGKRIPDFDAILSAASMLADQNVKFILCGVGDDYDRVLKESSKLPNVVMAGLCNQLELVSLASVSQVGLIPYRNTIDFKDSLPTKFSEYLSSSLIIFTTLSGLPRQVLEENGCGLYYSDANSLVDAVKNLVDNPNLVNEMKHKAYSLYQSQFDADVVYREFVNQLLEISSCYHSE